MSEQAKNRKGGVRRVLPWIALGVVVAGVGLYLVLPDPIEVETAKVTRGAMEVTVDQEGEVRVHDRYVIAAPVAGRLLRVRLHDGDPVVAGQVVARLEPAPLDPRGKQEALARVDAARATLREARYRVAQAEATLEQERRERERVEKLVAERFVSPEAMDKANTAEQTARAELEAARARAAAARYDLQAAEAALLALPGPDGDAGRAVELASPVTGKVLRVQEQSERTVAAGTPIMSIGDPARFEIVADVLSVDAVKIEPGDPARLEQWGGGHGLKAKVRLVEPYAFTKVSALGIEEQRVNVVMDPVDPLGPLGDGYRVEARIVIWSGTDVLKAPASALFRSGESWGVFIVEDARARKRVVKVGERNPLEAQILDGLQDGETVIKYPTNELHDGARVAAAKSGR